MGRVNGPHRGHGRFGGSRARALLAALSLSLIAVPAASANHSSSRSSLRYAQIRQLCPPPTPGHKTCFGLVRVPVAADVAASVGAKPYVPGDGAYEHGLAGGLTPKDLASAYAYSPEASGSGQTVAIVDAYNDPKIEEDLGTFDEHYGLAECTSANGCFKKVGQSGSTMSLPAADKEGWSGEIALDVDTVHGVCPKCKVLLVEVNAPSNADLAAGVNEAVALGATEVSNSYGGPEEPGEGPVEREAYEHPGVVITASAGDDGYYDWDYVTEGYEAPARANTPAALPTVVAVGGTSLKLESNGTRESESVWNDSGRPHEGEFKELKQYSGTGGGCSRIFTAPQWQQSTPGWASAACGTKRLDNDIAAVGDPYTGYDIYDTYECGSACTSEGVGKGWATIGGTSLSSPLIGALYGLAGGSGGVPYPALTPYGHLGDASDIYDVTEGGNGYCDAEANTPCEEPAINEEYGDLDCLGTSACDAAVGFDGPSGVGAPVGLGAFKPLFPTAVITPPSSPKAGIPASFSAGGSSDPSPGGVISNAVWNWGDGTGSGGLSQTHIYATPGVYTVTLTVTDNYGLTSTSATQSVTVGELTAQERAQLEEEAARPQREAAAAAAATAKREAEEAAARARLAQRVPDAKLAGTTFTVSASGTVAVKISCPATESSCAGTVTLRTLTAVSAARAAVAARKAILTLAKASFTVAGGKVKTITLHLSSAARKLLDHTHVLLTRATIVAHDPASATHTTQAIATLRAHKAKHRKG